MDQQVALAVVTAVVLAAVVIFLIVGLVVQIKADRQKYADDYLQHRISRL